ncbi:E3 ubiquitin-protein ligase TRIM39-like [Apteryx mantelli]|uniref:E3 ubiquitin-protein ligase TRIM39-like n=1 Tax=Apteryx mantelli TaxID=2696672 RepID=A0ABM4FZK6_9AVES
MPLSTGKALETNTTRALEAVQEEMERTLNEKLATLQNHVEVAHHAAPPLAESNVAELESKLGKALETNTTRALEAMQKEMERILSEKLATLQSYMEAALHAASRLVESSVAELQSKLEKAVETNTARALESVQEEMERILSEKLATLQSYVEAAHRAVLPPEELTSTWTSTLQNLSQEVQTLQRSLESMQASMQHERQHSRADLEGIMSQVEKVAQRFLSKINVAKLESKLEFVKMQRYTVDVTLDADTAHPRLELSPDGKSVKDTGAIRSVPRTEKRFDSHLFVLAKEGYTSGKRYWEVDVGKRRNWDVGIAREPVTRKGTLTLSPEKGFWVIGLADGKDYWARTVPWTRLAVSGKPRKIGIFLNVSAKKLSFFNANNGAHLHTFPLGGDSSQEGKFFPFFSTGSISAKPDTEPLKID